MSVHDFDNECEQTAAEFFKNPLFYLNALSKISYEVIYKPNGKRLGTIDKNEVDDWVYWSDQKGYTTEHFHQYIADTLKEFNNDPNR